MPSDQFPREFIPEQGVFMAIGIGLIVLTFAMGPLMFWGVLRKAGRPAWHSLIPVYQWVSVTEAVGKPAWWGWVSGLGMWIPVLMVPLLFAALGRWATDPSLAAPPGSEWFALVTALGSAGFVMQVFIAIAVAKAFGKGDGWLMGLILVPIVAYPMIGFGSSTYLGTPPAETTLPRPAPPPH